FLREPRLAVRAASGEIARALGEALLAGARFGELLSGASRRALAQAFERRFGPRELLGELLLGPRRSLVVQPIRGTARVLRQSARLLEQTARAAARLHGSGQRQAFEVLRHGAHVLARERGGSARRTGLRAGLREIVEPLPQARGALRGLAREIFGVLGAVRLGQRALDAADLFGVLGRELLELLNELIETL